jgi:8-oxo-dGTP pyrophosphatase MutT (NUDIX family)
MEDIFYLGIKAIIRNSDNKILLLETNPRKLVGSKNKKYWDIPGGRIQKGSSVLDTLKREVKEETGLVGLKSVELFSSVISNVRIPQKSESIGLILFSYLCEVKKIRKIIISDEHKQFGWFSPIEASKLLSVKYPKEFTDKVKEL